MSGAPHQMAMAPVVCLVVCAVSRLPWDNLEMIVLEERKVNQSEWIAPKTRYWELLHYATVHGDYLSNGLGHRKVRRQGKDFIAVRPLRTCDSSQCALQ